MNKCGRYLSGMAVDDIKTRPLQTFKWQAEKFV